MFRDSGPGSKGQTRGGNTVFGYKGPLSKVRGEVGTQCTDTQDLNLKAREEVIPQFKNSLDLYLNVRGELGTQCMDTKEIYLRSEERWEHSVQTLRTSIYRSGNSWEHSIQTLRTSI